MAQKQLYPRPPNGDEASRIKTAPSGVAIVQAILGDPQVAEFFTICLDKLSEPSSRVHIVVEPITLSAEEAKAFVAQDRFVFVTHQLEKARRAGDDELAGTLRLRLAEISKAL